MHQHQVSCFVIIHREKQLNLQQAAISREKKIVAINPSSYRYFCAFNRRPPPFTSSVEKMFTLSIPINVSLQDVLKVVMFPGRDFPARPRFSLPVSIPNLLSARETIAISPRDKVCFHALAWGWKWSAVYKQSFSSHRQQWMLSSLFNEDNPRSINAHRLGN